LLPLKKDEDGAIVTQYAMNPVGDLGLLKMDFLGLKTLTVIRNTCEMVKQGRGVDIPIDNLPLDDAKTYDLLNKANTIGIFQLESGGMRDLCRKFQISSVEHITALVALYRPGADGPDPGFHQAPPRRGADRIRASVAGAADARDLRRAHLPGASHAGRAGAGRLHAGRRRFAAPRHGQKERRRKWPAARNFRQGLRQDRQQYPAAKANQIFDLLEKFAGYGFNKSHAAAYAIVAYQTAYLKANYPVEFLSAMMTNDMGDTAKLGILIGEARQFGIEVLPPDVNESGVFFTPSRSPGGGSAGPFVSDWPPSKGSARWRSKAFWRRAAKGGPFKSLSELCERVDGRTVNRKVLEALIKSGACDCFGETRATMFAKIDRVLTRAAGIIQDRSGARTRCSACWRSAAERRAGKAIAGMAAARIAGARKGTARLLRHRPSADALRADPGKIRRPHTSQLASLPIAP
jgi:DNA polymerase-3 subunit alpha